MGVAIGFGFFLECTYEEALKFISKKKPILEEKIEEIEQKIAKVLANMRIVKK